MNIDGLSVSVFSVVLVFARVGAMMMVMPGLGEPAVLPRLRLALAVVLSLAITSLVGDRLPPAPEQAWDLAGMVLGEVLVGLMFGMIARLMMSALATAGQVAGMQTGLAFAQSFDPSQGRQGAILATLLNLVGVTLLFTTGLHHMFIGALVGSYDVLPPGHLPNVGDASTLALDTVAHSFRLGLQMTAPLIAFGLIFYLAMGVLSRLMPQVQIFFVAMPMNILAGLTIFALSLAAMMGVWISYMESYGAALTGSMH